MLWAILAKKIHIFKPKPFILMINIAFRMDRVDMLEHLGFGGPGMEALEPDAPELRQRRH